MNKKLRNAIKKAEEKQNEADLALQAVFKHLTFSGFSNDPNLSMASGNEIMTFGMDFYIIDDFHLYKS